MKNKISKIILIASLLASGITTAQEFYTCVPKRDWWLDVVREGSKKWKKIIIHLTPQSRQEEFKQTLQVGKYRVTAAGGGGKPETKEFTLTSSQKFKACAGGNYDGMGYKGKYSSHSEGGYGKGSQGILMREGFTNGEGCYMGVWGISNSGSYFQIDNLEMVLEGGSFDNSGYVIIEKWEL